MIHYRSITTNAVEPTDPATGDMWIKPIGTTYQSYMWIGAWKTLPSGGVYVVETNA